MRLFSMGRLTATFGCLALVLGTLGCGGSDRPEQFPVSGVVTLDDKPLTSGTVEFMPDSAKGTTGPIAFGQIGPDGTYKLKTFDPADGAKVGFYKVGVQCFEEVPFDPKSLAPQPPPKSLIPLNYADAARSGLTAEVKPGQTEPISFKLFSKP